MIKLKHDKIYVEKFYHAADRVQKNIWKWVIEKTLDAPYAKQWKTPFPRVQFKKIKNTISKKLKKKIIF